MTKNVVLCIDDEETVLDSLEMELSGKKNFTIELANSGPDALELIEDLIDNGQNLAVVICDYVMPQMKGDETLIKIHKKYPTTKKILLTGQSHIDGVTNSINEANLYRYIDKPWESKDLLLTVNAAVAQYEADKIIADQNQIIESLNAAVESMENEEDEDENQELSFDTSKMSEDEIYNQIYFARFYRSLEVDHKEWFALATIGIILADGKISKSELYYLHTILKDDRREEAVNRYMNLIKTKKQPKLEILRVKLNFSYQVMKLLTQVLITSKSIKPEEEKYFHHIGGKLGFEGSVVQDIIGFAKHRLKTNYLDYKLKTHISQLNPIYQNR